MAKRNRGDDTTSSKRTSMNGRRVSKKTKIDKTEITDSIEKNKFLDYSIQQKYNLTEVHDNFLDVCFKTNNQTISLHKTRCERTVETYYRLE